MNLDSAANEQIRQWLELFDPSELLNISRIEQAIMQGAGINTWMNAQQSTALMVACVNYYEDDGAAVEQVVRLLIRHRADPKQANITGYTSLNCVGPNSTVERILINEVQGKSDLFSMFQN